MKAVIIGAGASGLIAAIEAAKRGLHVKVFDKNNKVGRKILATGNGRCNITNQTIMPEHYHSRQPSFVKPVLHRFSTQTCVRYFRELGLEIREGERGRLYPMNFQSSTVVDILTHACLSLGVEFCLDTKVEKIERQGSKFSLHVNNTTDVCDACVVATGGMAMPKLGSCDSGYVFAKAFGHHIVSPFPSLVQLVCDDKAIHALSGVKIEGLVKVMVDKECVQEALGDILFTNYGISGSAILDISRVVASTLQTAKEVTIELDLMPTLSKEALENVLQKRLHFAGDKTLLLWLEGMMNKKLAPFIAKQASLGSIEYASKIGIKEIKKIAYALKHCSVQINDTKGFESAEVTAGGIDVREINAESFESKLVKNLYFCGEVLDVDGDCGGFNLHFAWASGYCAGLSVGKS